MPCRGGRNFFESSATTVRPEHPVRQRPKAPVRVPYGPGTLRKYVPSRFLCQLVLILWRVRMIRPRLPATMATMPQTMIAHPVPWTVPTLLAGTRGGGHSALGVPTDWEKTSVGSPPRGE